MESWVAIGLLVMCSMVFGYSVAMLVQIRRATRVLQAARQQFKAKNLDGMLDVLVRGL